MSVVEMAKCSDQEKQDNQKKMCYLILESS